MQNPKLKFAAAALTEPPQSPCGSTGFPAKRKPRALICSSAIGYYGDRGNEELVEESASGSGFLAGVCPRLGGLLLTRRSRPALEWLTCARRWVLDSNGGALAKMLPAFRFGVAGKLGSGRHWWSWISLRDAARAFVFTVEQEHVCGAVNLASPSAVTNAEFTRTLGRVLHRPTLLPVPAFLLRTFAGEMAQEMLLASQHVIPKRLLEAGFCFEDEKLEPTLRKLLR